MTVSVPPIASARLALIAQSLKINHLLQALSEQGFNTSAIARQEKEIAQTLGQQGTLVG
ncbi:hypothetical protein HIN52_02805, partial [Salmonella enterica subsp. enterica serovar Typhimurium]|nr:hypothetical protein [Salmonella enterica subsp. enterica serovar Typhimurium]